MNILTFPAHTKYFLDWSRTGHKFFIWQDDFWDYGFGPKPTNMVSCDNDSSIEYDLAVAHQVEQARIVKELLPQLPVIGVSHGTMPKDEYNPYTCAVVAASDWNMRYCTHPKKVIIPVGADPAIYSGYTGDIACLLTVADEIASRSVLRKGVTDIVASGLDHIYVGARNGSLENGLDRFGHNIIQAMMRHFRCFVYTPSDDASMGYSLVEALMTGMPVAISRFADWEKYIENGTSGMVSDDPMELHAFCTEIIHDRENALLVGNNARQMMIKNFPIENFVNSWNKLFDNTA